MPAIKAIETRAYGHRFRSRLEARWAVFFTQLGLRWEYEPEGFDLGGVAYLPDFRVWTPQGEPIWYEVKPEHLQRDSKFDRFVFFLSQEVGGDYLLPRVCLLNGNPLSFYTQNTPCPRCGQWLESEDVTPLNNDEIGARCGNCDTETPSGGGNPEEKDGLCGTIYHPYKGLIVVSNFYYLTFINTVYYAVETAMSARFEHGEAP